MYLQNRNRNKICKSNDAPMRQSHISHHCCERETLADLMAICPDSKNENKQNLYEFDFQSCGELYVLLITS